MSDTSLNSFSLASGALDVCGVACAPFRNDKKRLDTSDKMLPALSPLTSPVLACINVLVESVMTARRIVVTFNIVRGMLRNDGRRRKRAGPGSWCLT
jgi:hypothetical protein